MISYLSLINKTAILRNNRETRLQTTCEWKTEELSKMTNNYFYSLFHFHLYENIFDNDMFIEIYWLQ